MSKYKGLKRDQLEELVVEKLTWFLKYLTGQSSYPMGKFPTGIPSPQGGEYLIWVGCSEGTISFSLQDTNGVDYHNIKVDKFGGVRKVVDLVSTPFDDHGKLSFSKMVDIRCEGSIFYDSPDFYLWKLLSSVRKKEHILAYSIGLTEIQINC